MVVMIRVVLIGVLLGLVSVTYGQPDTITIGFGGYEAVSVSTSHNDGDTDGGSTLDFDGYLPNENSAARFLSQATVGYDVAEIQNVAAMGLEDWIDSQVAMPLVTSMEDITEAYRQYVIAQTSDNGTRSRYWRYAWWQYHMTEGDLLRQRMAYVLSQLLVISDESTFDSQGHAFANYYDILLSHSFGNYRDLLSQVSRHPAMGVYLTAMNNAKTDSTQNRFPDENYAREIMQLFSIGTTMLNMDGSQILDADGIAVPSYTNEDIVQLAKIFTGFTWWNQPNFGKNPFNLDSWLEPMVMWNEHHEPGPKYLLNGYVVPDRNPVDGMADFEDAIDNVFNHQNVPPFVSTFLIQRLVTANPSPAYVTRVASVFADNGQGVRGDLTAVLKAILLDNEAKDCAFADVGTYGSLKEPFLRYMQINKAFHATTLSGNYRNDMRTVLEYVDQRPLSSQTVFNFYQRDYQPIGPIEDENLVAPVFQITDGQSIAGYVNGLYRWLISQNVADESTLYGGEPSSDFEDEVSQLDFTSEVANATDDRLPILLDQLNLVLASGQLTDLSLGVIERMINQLDDDDEDDMLRRVHVAIYLVMTSPEYLINK